MKYFQCICRQPLFFHNAQCLKCGSELGFDPSLLQLGALNAVGENLWSLAQDPRPQPPQFRFCANGNEARACNWLVPSSSTVTLCSSCQLTRTIPDLTRPRNPQRLRAFEDAKRRVLFAVLNLGLPVVPKTEDAESGLAFDVLEPLPDGPPIVTGHAKGLITLNIAEADDDYRARNREALTEPYRTIIGHLRHELAHYYWDFLIRGSAWLPRCRAVFGDEREDYGAALKRHYAEGPPPDWANHFISAYAASHPWEDWAESWAHYMHLQATLETATEFGLQTEGLPLHVDPFGSEVLFEKTADGNADAFLTQVNAWVALTAVLNEVSRSMGQPDIYPFVLNGPSVTKLHFVHCVIVQQRGRANRVLRARGEGVPVPNASLSAPPPAPAPAVAQEK